MLKAILFDLDGTLIDSEQYYNNIMTDFCNMHGANCTNKDLYKAIGTTMDDTYKIMENLIGKDRKEFEKDYVYYRDVKNPLVFKEWLYDDVLDTFKMLKEKELKIAICSMSPYSYIKEFVESCGLNNVVDYYISGEDCKNNKPDSEIYLKALKELNIEAFEAIAVEDATTGIEAALRANLKVVARDASRFGVNQSKAYAIFKDLRKLLTII